ncbi:MAG TPA: hypothetical protein VFB70_10430, partial [Pyrinomonadaceae bacterium]|nr:hypothetical protein [Pyrinomonadaceae bacterium]
MVKHKFARSAKQQGGSSHPIVLSLSKEFLCGPLRIPASLREEHFQRGERREIRREPQEKNVN